jgi:hypothetical protein
VSKLVTGIFKSQASADQAIEDLERAGFSTSDLSVLMSQETSGREFAIERTTKAAEGAATGATVGGVIGAVVGGLVAVGTLAIPGLSLVAAGPLVAALSGLGAGAATGGITGALIGLGVPEHEAKFYNDEIGRGGILVGVYAHADVKERAKDILRGAGAEAVT